jgi:hypothetical protein
MDAMLRAREVVAARSWSTSPNIVIRMEEAAKLRDDRGSLPHLQIIGISTCRIVPAGWRIVST